MREDVERFIHPVPPLKRNIKPVDLPDHIKQILVYVTCELEALVVDRREYTQSDCVYMAETLLKRLKETKEVARELRRRGEDL